VGLKLEDMAEAREPFWRSASAPTPGKGAPAAVLAGCFLPRGGSAHRGQLAAKLRDDLL
jgi:hypothetical protein